MGFAPFGRYGSTHSIFHDTGDARLWPLIIVVPLLLFFSIWTPLFLMANNVTGHGTHYGYVTAVDTGGVAFITTSVGFKTDAESTQEDSYCVTEPSIISQLKSYADRNQRVKIYYTDYFLWGPGCQLEGPTITKVEKA